MTTQHTVKPAGGYPHVTNKPTMVNIFDTEQQMKLVSDGAVPLAGVTNWGPGELTGVLQTLKQTGRYLLDYGNGHKFLLQVVKPTDAGPAYDATDIPAFVPNAKAA